MRLGYELKKKRSNAKYTLVLDTETTPKDKNNPFACPLVYDIGITICAKNGSIVFSKQFIIEEIFDNIDLMSNAYYFEKRPLYITALEEGKAEKVRFIQARDEVIKLLVEYDVDVVSAYNYPFDRRAITQTMFYLYPTLKRYYNEGNPKKPEQKPTLNYTENMQKYFYHKDVKELCIMSFACETILQSMKYAEFCDKYDLYTDKGNISTNAENVYRYLTNQPHFIEEHTGQDDTIIEAFILAECYKKNQKNVKSGVLFNTWRMIQKNNLRLKNVDK